jgi:exosortase
MQISLAQLRLARLPFGQTGWLILAVLGALLVVPVVGGLWPVWMGDPTLSHGPLVPLIAGALVWMRREALRRWDAACAPGLALLALSSLVHVAAVWADIEFLKPLSLLGVTAGVIWFLGGHAALRATLGPLGFLVFMIPWPTTLVERLAFPLQLTSSAYAALFGGLLGLPIVRDGVHLLVVPNPNAPPVYEAVVARQCSGLTSLMVLLALGYLIAYHTPVRLGWRALLVAAVPPLALLTNSIRLTLILVAGTYHGAGMAKWVHDHEAPVLIFLCSLGLMGVRQALLAWTRPQQDEKDHAAVQIPAPGG